MNSDLNASHATAEAPPPAGPESAEATNDESRATTNTDSEHVRQLIARARHAISEGAKPWMRRAPDELKKPAVAAVVAGGVVAAVAGMWGPTEAGLVVLAAYGAYVLATRRRDRAPAARVAESHPGESGAQR